MRRVSVVAESNRTREVPAAVFVAQPVVRIRGQYFGRAHRKAFTQVIAITFQLVGERDVQPVLLSWIGIKGDAIRVAQAAKIGNYLLELACSGVEVIQNVDAAEGIVREVVHICDKNSSVRPLGHKAYALQSFC